jgi:hypothetical protein
MRPNDVWLIVFRALGVWCNLLCGLLFLSVRNEVSHFWPHSPPVLVSVLYPISIAARQPAASATLAAGWRVNRSLV